MGSMSTLCSRDPTRGVLHEFMPADPSSNGCGKKDSKQKPSGACARCGISLTPDPRPGGPGDPGELPKDDGRYYGPNADVPPLSSLPVPTEANVTPNLRKTMLAGLGVSGLGELGQATSRTISPMTPRGLCLSGRSSPCPGCASPVVCDASRIRSSDIRHRLSSFSFGSKTSGSRKTYTDEDKQLDMGLLKKQLGGSYKTLPLVKAMMDTPAETTKRNLDLEEANRKWRARQTAAAKLMKARILAMSQEKTGGDGDPVLSARK